MSATVESAKYPVFTEGQMIRCVQPEGYHNLTANKEYTVLSYGRLSMHSDYDSDYPWPAYVSLLGDDGVENRCFATRFVPAEEDKE